MKARVLMLMTLFAMLAAISFVGCGGDDNPTGSNGSNSSIVGTWTITGEICDGTPQNTTGSFTFNADGTASLTQDGTTFEATYTTSGSTLNANIGGQTGTVTFSISGDILTITDVDNGETCVMTLTKASTGSGSSIVGTWIMTGDICLEEDAVAGSWTFNADGTASVTIDGDTIPFTYIISGNILIIIGDSASPTFSISGNTLTITFGTVDENCVSTSTRSN